MDTRSILRGSIFQKLSERLQDVSKYSKRLSGKTFAHQIKLFEIQIKSSKHSKGGVGSTLNTFSQLKPHCDKSLITRKSHHPAHRKI